VGPSEELIDVIVLDVDHRSMARASCGCRTGEFTECVTNGSRTVEHDGVYHVGPAVSFFFGDDGQWCRSVDDLNDVHDRSVVNWCFAGLSRCVVLA